jgi:glucose/arabinose dehydrogenase
MRTGLGSITLAWLAASTAAFGLGAAWAGAEVLPVVPRGFAIAVFASGLGPVRALAIDPAGVLLASIPGHGRVVALADRGGRGRADSIVDVARNLDRPHGLAMHRSHLYVATTGQVLRFQYDAAGLRARDPVRVISDLPAGGHHWTRSIAIDPLRRIYVAIGSSCDVCREADQRRATIVRYDADGAGGRMFARGLRNPVGLVFDPATGALWTTVNERDWRSGGAPPDFVTQVTEGASYGWPDCYVVGGRFSPDPEFRGSGTCEHMTSPTIELPPHSAPLGLAFYSARQFPALYRGSLFVALHGSRAGLPPTGYKIVRIAFERGRASAVHDFATGWIRDARVVGRPVDLIVARDGSLLVSDDHAGRIYRITYRP